MMLKAVDFFMILLYNLQTIIIKRPLGWLFTRKYESLGFTLFIPLYFFQYIYLNTYCVHNNKQ